MKRRNALKTLRERAGLSQEETAMILGVSTVSIQNWESGQRMRYPSMLSDLLEIYGAGETERICALVLMYGDSRDVEFINSRLMWKD